MTTCSLIRNYAFDERLVPADNGNRLSRRGKETERI